MKSFVKGWRKFLCDESGLETVEYAVLGALIIIAIVLTIAALGQQIAATFNALINAMAPAPPPPPPP